MNLKGWRLAGLLGLAALALWLLLAGTRQVLGLDPGNLGVALLMTAAWVSLWAVAQTPGHEVDGQVSPAEWQAWVGFGFMLLAVAYFLAKAQVFQQGSAWDNPDATRVARNLVLLLVAWTVLSGVMRARWKGKVLHDERDAEVERHAAGWGRGALVFCIIGIAVMLAFSPASRLQWATHFTVANLLVFALMWGWLCEYAATALLYWRQRR